MSIGNRPPSVRGDGRAPRDLRPISFELGVQKWAEGSCIVQFGDTRVFDTSSVDATPHAASDCITVPDAHLLFTGEFKRTEAYGSPAGYGKCTGIGQPDPAYCAAPITPGAPTDPYNVKGEQYNVVDESVPAIIGLPMLPRLAIRYQPLPELAIRVEGAYGLAQVWLGLSAAYAPEL